LFIKLCTKHKYALLLTFFLVIFFGAAGICPAEERVKGTDLSCRRMNGKDHAQLPAKNAQVDLAQIRKICREYGLEELWQKIKADPPARPFASDGCSLWLDKYNGISLYPACFLHDLKYWAGYPDEDIARLQADAELMIDVACLLNSTTMAESMFYGTRVGGHEIYDQSFSWGFGRID